MKSLVLFLNFLLSVSSFAQTDLLPKTLTFKGVVKDSFFKEVNGAVCTLKLVLEKAPRSLPSKPGLGISYSYRGYLSIKGFDFHSHPRQAVASKMVLTDYDAYARGLNPKETLSGRGSKYGEQKMGGMTVIEASQTIWVHLNSEGQITSWDYQDGTETLFGKTFSCQAF